MTTAPPTRLSLRRPDDWHVHLRDGPALAAVVPATARVFGRAVVMPNLRPPVTTLEAARAYRERVLAAVPAGARFEPLMTLYLTDNTPADEIARAKASGFVVAAKYYPAGATTNSDAGVTALERAYPAIAAMEKHGLVLSLHGEVTDADVDIYDRERVFVDRRLAGLVRDFPGLKVVVEHITTREAAQFVADAGPQVAATITPQHLLWSRNAMLVGGVRPHYYCLPILKRETHRQALVAAATARQREVLPRHRQRAARAAHEGERLRLRRLLLRAARARAVRRGVRGRGRARPARGLRERARRELLRARAARRPGDAGPRGLDRPGELSVRRGHPRAAACGGTGALARPGVRFVARPRLRVTRRPAPNFPRRGVS